MTARSEPACLYVSVYLAPIHVLIDTQDDVGDAPIVFKREQASRCGTRAPACLLACRAKIWETGISVERLRLSSCWLTWVARDYAGAQSAVAVLEPVNHLHRSAGEVCG